MELFTIVLLVGILVVILNLRNRVHKLEQLVKGVPGQVLESSSLKNEIQQTSEGPIFDYIRQQLKQGVAIEEIGKSLVAAGWQIADIGNAFKTLGLITPTITPATPAKEVGPTSLEKFGKWIQEDWMLKLGAMLLLIGFGWLTTYAFLNNWIGPMGRIALGIFAGVAFLLLGWWRIPKYIHQGGIFLVLGSTTILLTIYAAREVYGYFTPFTALAVMFLSTAFVALASVKFNSRSLALSSVILAGIAPLLTNSPTTDYVGLFLYLFVVILGTVWIVILTGRRELTIAGLVLVLLYSLPHFSSFVYTGADKGLLLMFAYAFSAVFFLTNTSGLLRLTGKEIKSDVIGAVGNGLFLLAWISFAAPKEWASLIISAWMVVFVAGAFVIYKITQRREPFYVYSCVAIAMLAAATAIELHGPDLTIAYTIESGIVALISYLVLKDIKIALRSMYLLIGPAVLSVGSITSYAWETGYIHRDFFVLLVLGGTFLGLGLFFLPAVRASEDKETKQLNSILLIFGSLYFYAIIWLALPTMLLDKNLAVMVALVIYTIIGLASYFYGLANSKKVLQLYGGTLVGFVVARLLMVDVWRMELAGRIITFFLIGALLVSTAFLGKKKHDEVVTTNVQ